MGSRGAGPDGDDPHGPLADVDGIKAASRAYDASGALAALTALFGFRLADSTLDELTLHVIALIEMKRDHRSVWRLTAQDLDDIAGRVLTDDELERIASAIDNSTAADAVRAAVEQVAGFPDDEAGCHHSFNRDELLCDSCGIDIKEVP